MATFRASTFPRRNRVRISRRFALRFKRASGWLRNANIDGTHRNCRFFGVRANCILENVAVTRENVAQNVEEDEVFRSGKSTNRSAAIEMRISR